MKSVPIWTQEELLSDVKILKKQPVWRMVEDQNQIATLQITSNLSDQSLLEEILESRKPPLPNSNSDNLHYLLFTPFRYKTVNGATDTDKGSRFRSSGCTDGVFYCAEHVDTAAYEAAFYKALFFNESPGLTPPSSGLQLTAFSCYLSSKMVIDLTIHQTLQRWSGEWENLDNYNQCQALAADARTAGIEIIAYKSVRDPQGRKNYAVLTPNVFDNPSIIATQSWTCVIRQEGVYMHPTMSRKSLFLSRSDIGKDNRFK